VGGGASLAAAGMSAGVAALVSGSIEGLQANRKAVWLGALAWHGHARGAGGGGGPLSISTEAPAWACGAGRSRTGVGTHTSSACPTQFASVCVVVVISKAGHTPPSAYAVADTRSESRLDVEISGSDSGQAAAAGGIRMREVSGRVARPPRVRDETRSGTGSGGGVPRVKQSGGPGLVTVAVVPARARGAVHAREAAGDLWLAVGQRHKSAVRLVCVGEWMGRHPPARTARQVLLWS